MENYNKAHKEAVLIPRLLSVQGYQKLFDQALHNSLLRKRQDNTDEEIRKLKEEIAQLKVKDQELKDNIDLVDKTQNEARAKTIANQEDQNKKFGVQFKDAFK